MQTMINNLINGNISEARKQAKRFSQSSIEDALVQNYGWCMNRAILAAHFLKTGQGWQQYCDVK